MPARLVLIACLLLLSIVPTGLAADKQVETFNAYVDSNVCAHVMLGPITPERIECSRTTYKQGSDRRWFAFKTTPSLK